MKLCLYRGPATGILKTLGHWAICVGTLSRYSHCELVIDGACWTSSYVDGGVRGKVIDLTTGKWDVLDIGGTPEQQAAALGWFQAHLGAPYDWPGIVRFVLPFVPQKPGRYFCSEAVAAALMAAGMLPAGDPSGITPKDLAGYFANH